MLLVCLPLPVRTNPMECNYQWLQGLQKGQERKKREGIALYIKKWIGCKKLSLKNRHKQVESLWVKIKTQGNKGKFVAGVQAQAVALREVLLMKPSYSLQEASCCKLSSYRTTSS